MSDRKNYLDVPWAVFEGDKVVPADYKRTGFVTIAQCYMCTTNVDQPEKAHAAHIVELHNALLGSPATRSAPRQLFQWKADVVVDLTFPDDKDRNEHCVEVIVADMNGDAVGSTVAYATEAEFAKRMVECVNALWGIPDPTGYITMMKAHVAAQHDSLGRMADLAADTSKILGENGELISRVGLHIEALEAKLQRWLDVFGHLSDDPDKVGNMWLEQRDALDMCERVFQEALPKFNWGASALDANAIDLLNRAPTMVRAITNPKKEAS